MDVKKTLIVGETGGLETASLQGSADRACATDASECLSELIALVERALDTADTMGLPFVGLDLCSALEKLNEHRASLYPSENLQTGD